MTETPDPRTGQEAVELLVTSRPSPTGGAETTTGSDPTGATTVPASAEAATRTATFGLRAQPSHATAPISPIWELSQRLLAVCALIASAPLWPLLYLWVRLDSRGPFLFGQWRLGLDEQPFRIWKIRTLHHGSESSTALGVDRRSTAVTRAGRILRRLKLDELPQLVNVACGHLNLVGPRPLPLALDEQLRAEIPGFAARYRVRPGLTSLAQVTLIDNSLGDRLIEDWRRRSEIEQHYARHRSMRYDAVVMLLTVSYVLRSAWHGDRQFAAIGRPLTAPPHRARATAVLGVPICNLDYGGVQAHIARWVRDQESRVVAICPVHSVVESLLDAHHRHHLATADLCTADGVPVVWAQRALGHRAASRVYGPELMRRLLAQAEESGWRVAFYGGKPGRLVRLLRHLRTDYPALDVVYAKSPPFRTLSPAEDVAQCAELRRARPDLVFIGLGCPKQERFMAEHKGRIPGVQLGVGAAFDFLAGAVPQAPRWLQRAGLEWLFRLIQEPRRLAGRYLKTNPIYVVAILGQLIRYRLGRSFDLPLNDASQSNPETR